MARYAIVSVDPSGRVTSWCTSAEKLFGYERRDMLGKPLSLLYATASDGPARSELELSLANSDGHSEDEGWLVRKDGSSFYAFGHTTKLEPGGDGRPRGFVKIVCDATDRYVRDGHGATKRAILDAGRSAPRPTGIRVAV